MRVKSAGSLRVLSSHSRKLRSRPYSWFKDTLCGVSDSIELRRLSVEPFDSLPDLRCLCSACLPGLIRYPTLRRFLEDSFLESVIMMQEQRRMPFQPFRQHQIGLNHRFHFVPSIPSQFLTQPSSSNRREVEFVLFSSFNPLISDFATSTHKSIHIHRLTCPTPTVRLRQGPRPVLARPRGWAQELNPGRHLCRVYRHSPSRLRVEVHYCIPARSLGRAWLLTSMPYPLRARLPTDRCRQFRRCRTSQMNHTRPWRQ
jgi:hypothetical protein